MLTTGLISGTTRGSGLPAWRCPSITAGTATTRYAP
ncbi:uncharacterized protein METZ01_LOCUS186065, partial [marine metagenome]